MQFKGITDVEVGYAGGHTENPDYESVCGEGTGHAEVARVIFDEAVIPAEVVLDIFFTLHDPTQLNRQGNDIGTSYRSAMYYTDENQKELFENAIEKAKERWGDRIVTELAPLEKFWMGEEYHQDFFLKNPNQGYCNAVVAPKMQKTRAAFLDYIKN